MLLHQSKLPGLLVLHDEQTLFPLLNITFFDYSFKYHIQQLADS